VGRRRLVKRRNPKILEELKTGTPAEECGGEGPPGGAPRCDRSPKRCGGAKGSGTTGRGSACFPATQRTFEEPRERRLLFIGRIFKHR